MMTNYTAETKNTLAAKVSPGLSDLIYDSAAEKDQMVILGNRPDEGNLLVAEAVHDFSSRAEKTFFALSCHNQMEHRSRISITHPVYYELHDIFKNSALLQSMKGGTVMLTDPYSLPANQQQALRDILVDELDLKVIINMKSVPKIISHDFAFPQPQELQVIKIGSLRNKVADIRFAATYFLSKANIEWNKNIPGICEECMQLFINYPWPGQLPQLKDVIRQAAFLAPEHETLSVQSLPAVVRNFNATERDFLKEAVKQAEYELIHKTLRETNNNKRKAAEILKISRKTLYSKINMYKRSDYN